MKKRILVCEDDQAISEIMKIMLEQGGFEVKLLSSGKAILKQVKNFQPHLILLDIWLPGIDGKEIIKILKKDPKLNQIPIIIVSALHEKEVLQIVKDLQVAGFLLKPFNMSALLAIVEKFTVYS